MKEFISKTPLEKIFVILALFFGLFYVFILPPFQSVDEGNHFFRTYQISEGNLISKNISDNTSNGNDKVGDYIPVSLSDFYNDYTKFIKNIDKKQTLSNIRMDFDRELDANTTQFTAFANTSLYSPICYVSQMPGVILGKLLTNRLAVIYYLGRISNLLFYCLIVYFAIKIIPFYKMPLMLLAIMPMSLSLASSYTCDVVVFGLNFLWIAIILKLIINNDDYNKGDIKYFVGLAILAFLMPLTKSYILLLPLYFLILPNKFKNLKSYIITILTLILSALIGGMLWYMSSKGLTLNMNSTVADASSQVSYILQHPLDYLLVLLKTFFVKTPRLIITMIGVLGWQDTRLDWSTYILYPILIYLTIFSDNYKFELQKCQKVVILITLIIGIIATYTSLYVMWTPVGNGVVLGLNGKYFIPMMLPMFLLFKQSTPKFDYNKIVPFVIVMLILILFTSELSLLHRFYNITPNLYYKV